MRAPRTGAWLAALLLLLGATACAGPAGDAGEGGTIVTRERIDTTQPRTALQAVTSPTGECRHVYEQAGVHSYQRLVDGLPQVGLCVINRCIRCGKVLHECQRGR